MIDKQDIEDQIDLLQSQCSALRLALGRSTKITFMECLASAEDTIAEIRHLVIRHSRQLKAGITKDGKPDRRFSLHRQPKRDLRKN